MLNSSTDLRPLILRAHQDVMLELEYHFVFHGAGMPWGLPYFSQTPEGPVRWYHRPDLLGHPMRRLRCSLCGGANRRPGGYIHIVGMPKGVRDPRYFLIFDDGCRELLRPWIKSLFEGRE